jgi:GT2 family glycosyltransferase
LLAPSEFRDRIGRVPGATTNENRAGQSHLVGYYGNQRSVRLRRHRRHHYRRMPADHRGYCNPLTTPREISAVTAACIAVARDKFQAIGGFDAENLPVDLNDMDLCLRIYDEPRYRS